MKCLSNNFFQTVTLSKYLTMNPELDLGDGFWTLQLNRYFEKIANNFDSIDTVDKNYQFIRGIIA